MHLIFISFCVFITAELVHKRFDYNRGDYGKLKRRITEAKSNHKTLKALTEIQQWKLNHYACYEPYLKRRRPDRQDREDELGNVSICRT